MADSLNIIVYVHYDKNAKMNKNGVTKMGSGLSPPHHSSILTIRLIVE